MGQHGRVEADDLASAPFKRVCSLPSHSHDSDHEAIMTNIFAGGKFYVSLQVPECNKVKATIRDHGGEVTTKEADAHYLLFDPDKAHKAPNGALNYRIILDSVKEKCFQNQDRYRLQNIGPRPVGSIRPIKTRRAKFTAEEDITIWTLANDYEAGKIAPGKAEMWKNLERQVNDWELRNTLQFKGNCNQNPRHTWQSYQDRYTKILKHNPPAGVRTETRDSASQTSRKRGQSEDDQQNESNTKKKRTSIEADPERNEASNGSEGIKAQRPVQAESTTKGVDEAANTHAHNEDTQQQEMALSQPENGIADRDTQMGESMPDMFSLPLPPGGFETQPQETDGADHNFSLEFDDVDQEDEQHEEEESDVPAKETQTSFPELIQKFLDEGYNNNEVRTVSST